MSTDRDALAEALRKTRMVAYDDGKGGHLFRAAGPEEQADALLASPQFASLKREWQVEAEIAGQMKHITAEVARGDVPLSDNEEMIADLRARLSHAEAERDEALEALRGRLRDVAPAAIASAERQAQEVEARAAQFASLIAEAKAEALREFADNLGVNVGDEDDEWWRGYRQAQRETIHKAARAAMAATRGTDQAEEEK